MRLTRYRGLLVVVAWQATPSPVAVDSTGRVQGVLGFGTGQYEWVRTSCEGDVLDASPVEYQGAGGQLDAWLTRSFRVSGFGGAISSDSAVWDGGYFGGLAALELQHFGVGLGAVALPASETLPAAYLRAGSRDALHLRFDMAPPSPPFGLSGTARIGVGYRLGHLRQLGVLGGLALCNAACDGNSRESLFAELSVPVSSRLDLEFRGLIGGGEEYVNSGLAIGGRYHFVR